MSTTQENGQSIEDTQGAASTEQGTGDPDTSRKDQAEDGLSQGEIAMRRAEARAKDAQSTESDGTDDATEQALDTKDEESTQTDAGDDDTTDNKEGDETGSDEDPASTLSAPEDWSKEDREAFSQLPKEGQELLLGQHKNMQSRFTKALTEVADIRKQSAELIEIGERFNRDPKATIIELAKSAGIEEIYFERPEPEGELPNLDSPEAVVEYAAKQAEKKILDKQKADNAAKAEQEQKEKEETQAKAAAEKLDQEWSQASKDHPDFLDNRVAVADLLAEHPALSVEQAYQLTMYPRLMEEFGKSTGQTEKIKQLEAELASYKAGATSPAGAGDPGTSHKDQAEEGLSQGEIAMRRAERRLAQSA